MITAQLLEPGHRSKVYSATRKASSFRRSAQKHYIYLQILSILENMWWIICNAHIYNCTHIYAVKACKCYMMYDIWQILINFGQLTFTTAPIHKLSFFLRLWTGEVDHSKLGPGKVHEIIGLPAAMMDGYPSPVADPCTPSSGNGYCPRCIIFSFEYFLKLGYAKDSSYMTKFHYTYINYMTPTLWGGEQLYKSI